jgi:hypothetical protein
LFPNSPKGSTFAKLKGDNWTLWNLKFKPYVEISSILLTKKNPLCMGENTLK